MVTFSISGKLLLVTNFCPMFSDLDDKAFLNRIVLIDFNNIPKSFDTNLKEKLLAKDSRDEIFTYLANIAHEILSKKEIFIHERFKTNKQRILINRNSTISLFWQKHIQPDTMYYPGNILTHHPIALLYNTVYKLFCNSIGAKSLQLEAFAKEFKLLADQFSYVNWHKGKSKNYYTGFSVVDAYNYNNILFMAANDPVKIFE